MFASSHSMTTIVMTFFILFFFAITSPSMVNAGIDGLYHDVELSNKDGFSFRQAFRIESEKLLDQAQTSLLNKCNKMNNTKVVAACNIGAPLIKAGIEQLIPEIALLESISIGAKINGSTGSGGPAGIANSNAKADVHGDVLLFSILTPRKSQLSSLIPMLPSYAFAYFGGGAKADLSLKKGININMNAMAIGMASAYDSLFEFEDANNNGLFDEGEFTAGKHHKIELGKVEWEKLNSDPNREYVSSDKAIYTFESSTVDGVFTMKVNVATKTVIDANGAYLTPNNTKCDVIINKFPFKSKTTKLALKTYIASAKADFAAGAQASYKLDYSTLPAAAADPSMQAYASWNDTATTQTGSPLEVNAKGLALAKVGNMGLVAHLSLSSDAKAYMTHFTFNKLNPEKVVWDPELGFGKQPEESKNWREQKRINENVNNIPNNDNNNNNNSGTNNSGTKRALPRAVLFGIIACSIVALLLVVFIVGKVSASNKDEECGGTPMQTIQNPYCMPMGPMGMGMNPYAMNPVLALPPNVYNQFAPKSMSDRLSRPLPSSNSTGLGKYRATEDYIASRDGDISFVKGDILLVDKMYDDGWCEGCVLYSDVPSNSSQRGTFPGNFCTKI